MTIRTFRDADAEAMSSLYRRTVKAIGSRDYNPAQVAVWARLAPTPDRLREYAADGRTTLVAVDDADAPLAFGDLEADGHIHFLYCAPEAAGTGVTAALYGELERRARDAGMARVYAEASEAARRFFLKQGFTVVARRDFEVEGVPIHNYDVEKRLG